MYVKIEALRIKRDSYYSFKHVWLRIAIITDRKVIKFSYAYSLVENQNRKEMSE